MANAVDNNAIAKIVGYELTKGDFSNVTPNLPQRIAVLAEANTANQGTLDLTPTEILSASQAGKLYGYGSPIHQIVRILRPLSGSGVGSIPLVVYPQAAAVASVAKSISIEITGTATTNTTHTLIINGRDNVDGQFYNINIETGDTDVEVISKIVDAVNGVLGTPVIASDETDFAQLLAKWTGLTSNDINVSIETNGNDAGLTYDVTILVAGSGTPSVQNALDLFGNVWNTLVLNSYGLHAQTVTTLEAFNGKPSPDGVQAPTGRYTGIIMKPFIAISGSVLEENSTFADSKKDEVTIAIAPAPLSLGMQFEAAANMTVLSSVTYQNTPHLDVNDQTYPDMPIPKVIGMMDIYLNRDFLVKKGNSTVELSNGKYKVQDFITTYHPDGELPPQFRYVRNLMLDFNVRFAYYLLEQQNVVNHVIANDDDVVTAEKVVKPKIWKGIINNMAVGLVQRGLIADAQFTQDSITVSISSTNPDRLNSFFKYKRTGVARISATVAQAGFNFGNV